MLVYFLLGCHSLYNELLSGFNLYLPNSTMADPDKGLPVIFKKPKTQNSLRTVPLSKELIHELRLWKMRSPLSTPVTWFGNLRPTQAGSSPQGFGADSKDCGRAKNPKAHDTAFLAPYLRKLITREKSPGARSELFPNASARTPRSSRHSCEYQGKWRITLAVDPHAEDSCPRCVRARYGETVGRSTSARCTVPINPLRF